MAEVYLAELAGPSGFSKRFAIKQILPELSADPDSVQLLLDEAKLAAGLSHPNICQVYELGIADERPFIVMEHLDGLPLGALLSATSAPAPLPQAWAVARAAEGLSYAHQKRDHEGRPLAIVHRDVSLDNVMVTLDGQVKLLDFGIARAAHKSGRTKTGLVRGKIAYMSPEQIRNEPLDARTDVYSLGVVLWELLAGRRLYSSQNDVQTMYAVLSGPLPARPTDRPVPSALWEIAEAAMAREATGRLPSAALLAEGIDRALEAMGYREGAADLARMVLAQRSASRAAPELRAEAGRLGSSDAPTNGAPLALGQGSERSSRTADAEAPPRTRTADASAPPPPRTRTADAEAPPPPRTRTADAEAPPRTRTADAEAPPPTRTAHAEAPPPPRTADAEARSGPGAPGRPRLMLGLALTVTAAVAVAVGLYPTTEAMRAPPPALDPRPSSPAAPEATGAAAPSPAAPEATGAAAPIPTAPSPAPPSPARAVAVSDAPAKRRAPRSSPRPSAPAPTGTGRLVLDTHPWTKIYLGGRFLGDTPLNEVAVPAGHLELRAVNVELGIDKLIEVDVAPDRLVRLRREW